MSTVGVTALPVQKDSFLKSMSLYSKFAIFVGFVATAMVYNNPIALIPFFLLSLSMCFASGISYRALLKTLKAVIGIFLMLFLFSAFMYDVKSAHNDLAKIIYFTLFKTQYVTVSLTSGGMLSGISFIIKMMIMVLASNLFSQTTTIEEMLFGLNRMGLPYQFGLMLSIALRFIPTLTKDVEHIQQAQKSRGASSKKNKKKGKGASVQGVIPLFVPMIVSSMRRSDTMAMSMTSRGYGFSNKRTQMLDVKFRLPQILFWLFTIGVVVICIYIKKKYGFGIL